MLAPLLAAVLLAAEPPPVPDPYGLGERLALMDHLREAYRLTPVPGTPVEDLRTLYAEAWRRTQPADDEAAIRRRDDAARLRQRIADRHHREVAATLSLEDLQALWKQLEAQREATDAATIAARLREDPVPVRRPRPEPAEPVEITAPVPAAIKAPNVPTAFQRMTVRDLAFSAAGVAQCRLFQGQHAMLGIQFGAERGREFHGVFEYLADQLQRSRGPRSAIILLGHGSGASIAGEAIDGHLRRWKTFYETFGGTRPAAPVECLVIASCSRGSPVQMAEMRDGLGYYPVWRVATADRTYANAPSVIAAFMGVVAQDAETPFRGIYRWGKGEDSPASIAEAGRDGARGNMRYFTVSAGANAFVIDER